jgi:hypothetical protein
MVRIAFQIDDSWLVSYIFLQVEVILDRRYYGPIQWTIVPLFFNSTLSVVHIYETSEWGVHSWAICGVTQHVVSVNQIILLRCRCWSLLLSRSITWLSFCSNVMKLLWQDRNWSWVSWCSFFIEWACLGDRYFCLPWLAAFRKPFMDYLSVFYRSLGWIVCRTWPWIILSMISVVVSLQPYFSCM